MSEARPLRILAVEDESVARRRIVRLAREYFGPRLRWLDEASTADEAEHFLSVSPPDLLLLDLELHGKNGYALLYSDAPPTIIVSANVQHALEAFEHSVLDFVSKPISEARLRKAFTRFEQSARFTQQRFVLRQSGRLRLLPFHNILRFSAADDYVEIILGDGTRLLHDGRLSAVEEQAPSQFVRIHRSHIINLDYLQQVVKQGHRWAALLENGHEVPISANRQPLLRAELRRR